MNIITNKERKMRKMVKNESTKRAPQEVVEVIKIILNKNDNIKKTIKMSELCEN